MRLCKVFQRLYPIILSLPFLAGPLSHALAQSVSEVPFSFKIDLAFGPFKSPAAPINLDLGDSGQKLDGAAATVLKATPYILQQKGDRVYFVQSGKVLQLTEHGRDDKGTFSLPVYVEPSTGIRAASAMTIRVENNPKGLLDMHLTVVHRPDGAAPALIGQVRNIGGKPVILICPEPACPALESQVQALLSGNPAAPQNLNVAAPTPPNPDKEKQANPPEKPATADKDRKVHLYAYDPSTGRPKGEFAMGVFSSSACDAGGPFGDSALKKIPSSGEADFTLPIGDGVSPYCVVIVDKLYGRHCYRVPRSLAEPTISLPFNDNLLRTYDSCPEPLYTLQVRESGKDRTAEFKSKITIRGFAANSQGKIQLYETSLRPGDVRVDSEDYGVSPEGATVNTDDHTVFVPIESISIDLDNVKFRFVDDLDRPEKYCAFQLMVPTSALLPPSTASSPELSLPLVFDAQKSYFKAKPPAGQKIKLSIPALKTKDARIEHSKDNKDKDSCAPGRPQFDVALADLKAGEIKTTVSEAKPFVSLIAIPDAKLSKVAPSDVDRSRVWSLVLNAFDKATKQDDPAVWDTVQMFIAEGDGQFTLSAKRSYNEQPFGADTFQDLNAVLTSRSAADAKSVQVPINDVLFQKAVEPAGVSQPSKKVKQVIVLAGNLVEKNSVCDDLAMKAVSRYRFMTDGNSANLVIIDFLPGGDSSHLTPVDEKVGEFLRCDVPADGDVASRISYLAINIPPILRSAAAVRNDIEQRLAVELKKQMTSVREAWR